MFRKLFRQLFGKGHRRDYSALIEQGAVIIDVRSAAEFERGHLQHSRNIPLEELPSIVDELKDETVITCCQSGYRSAIATDLLKSKGIKAINGGSWIALKRGLEK